MVLNTGVTKVREAGSLCFKSLLEKQGVREYGGGLGGAPPHQAKLRVVETRWAPSNGAAFLNAQSV